MRLHILYYFAAAAHILANKLRITAGVKTFLAAENRFSKFTLFSSEASLLRYKDDIYIHCFVRQSVGHALKDVNVILLRIRDLLVFAYFFSLFLCYETEYLLYNSLCLFFNPMIFCALLLMDVVIIVKL